MPPKRRRGRAGAGRAAAAASLPRLVVVVAGDSVDATGGAGVAAGGTAGGDPTGAAAAAVTVCERVSARASEADPHAAAPAAATDPAAAAAAATGAAAAAPSSAATVTLRGEVRGFQWLTPHLADERRAYRGLKPAFEVDVDLVADAETDLGPAPHYLPGDAFAVRPPNAEDDVRAVLARLGHAEEDWAVVVEPENSADADAAESTPPVARRPAPHLPCVGERVRVGQLLRWWVDLRGAPKKRTLKALAACTTDATEQATLRSWSDVRDRAGSAEYRRLCVVRGWPSLPQLLRRFPSCAPTLQDICTLYPPLAPRYYSVTSCCTCGSSSSSSSSSRCRVSFALNFSQYSTVWSRAEEQGRRVDEEDQVEQAVEQQDGSDARGGEDDVDDDDHPDAVVDGLCSRYLLDLGTRAMQPPSAAPDATPSSPPRLLMFRKARQHPVPFTYPLPSGRRRRPWIGLGAGTGIAPFRSFLRSAAGQAAAEDEEEGEQRRSSDLNVLIQGSRYTVDALFHDELEQLCGESGTQLARVESRSTPGASVRYVQHLMVEDAALAQRVKEGMSKALACAMAGQSPLDTDTVDAGAAVLYLCGDAKGLFIGVKAALNQILSEGTGTTTSASDETPADVLRRVGWFVCDIW